MNTDLRLFRYLIAAIAGFALCVPLWAQFRSSIEGTVTDSSGAVVSGAQVTLTNVDTGIAQNAQSNDTGAFRFPTLPPGNYKVSAGKSGFKTTTQENVSLLAQEIKTVPIMLQPGQVQEAVTVTTELPPVQFAESKIASDISAREIRE